MKITTEEAQKIALLSRLSFAEEDLEKMRDSMNSILTYMEELNWLSEVLQLPSDLVIHRR